MLFLHYVVLFAAISPAVEGHGRLVMPPSRSTMWRLGYSNPPNYNDNQGFCGGFSVQWNQNNGQCGICGDNIKDNPRQREKPDGKYANGIIVGKYETGQTMEIKVHLTANHKGYFEYRLCQNNDKEAAVTQACLDQNLLAAEDGATRFTILPDMKHVMHTVKLPAGLTCSACVLQWKYNTGNSWGKDLSTGKGCVGCGPQEQFYACADIAIGVDGVETGDHDTPVEVPEGDVDERVEMNKTDEYDHEGGCVCKCGQTSAAVTSVGISVVSIGLCMAFVQSFYILFTR